MVSSLKCRSKRPRYIPKRAWKGKGCYYHRGNKVWTKYSQTRDSHRKSKIRKASYGTAMKWRHTHDTSKHPRI